MHRCTQELPFLQSAVTRDCWQGLLLLCFPGGTLEAADKQLQFRLTRLCSSSSLCSPGWTLQAVDALLQLRLTRLCSSSSLCSPGWTLQAVDALLQLWLTRLCSSSSLCSPGWTLQAVDALLQFRLTGLHSSSLVPQAPHLKQFFLPSLLRLHSWSSEHTAPVSTHQIVQPFLSAPLWLDSCSSWQTPLQIALTRDCVEGFLCSLSPGLASRSSWHTSFGLFPVFCTILQ